MIVHLTFPACNRRGGIERCVADSANFLAARGHYASVISGSIDPGALNDNVHAVPVEMGGGNAILQNIRFRRRSTRILDRLRSTPPFGGQKQVHAAFGVTCPPDAVFWVPSVHAEWIKISRQHRDWKGRLKQRLNLFHPFILKLERNYFRGKKYRRLLALTPRVKSEIIEHYDVPANDIDVLPNGFSPQEFNPKRRQQLRDTVRAELGYTTDEVNSDSKDRDLVLVFVANELERKGFFPLVEGLSRLKDPRIKLLVVGRVTIEPHQSLLEKLGIANQVKCVGSTADVGRYYAAADLFVLPTYYEAWGLVIVEALAMGLPVVTSRVAGASIAVQENRTGWLLDDPHDPAEIASKIEQALSSQEMTGEQIAQSVDDYRWDRVLLKYESILDAYSN